MPSTTIAAIREKQEDVIIGLSPASHSQAKFGVERAEIDFREWCEANPVESLRKFSIRQVDGVQPANASNWHTEQRRAFLELTISYPKTFGLYGGQGSQSMRDIIREDQHKIAEALGVNGSANYARGQNLAIDPEGGRIEEGGAVVFLVFGFEIDYFLLMGTDPALPLAGAISAVATSIGDLLPSGTRSLGGAVSAAATASANLLEINTLQGAASAAATTSADLLEINVLQGLVSAAATASGDVSLILALQGAASAAATATADLLEVNTLQGAASAAATTSGDFQPVTGILALEGIANAAATATADLLEINVLQGAASAAATTTGDMLEVNVLQGAASAAATATGDLKIPASFTFTLHSTINTGTNSTTYTSGTFTPKASAMVIVDVNCRAFSGGVQTPTSVSHSGDLGSFTLETSADPDAATRVCRYVTYSDSSPTSGTVTITYANSRTFCTAFCYSVEGANTTDGLGASDTDAGTGTSRTTSLASTIDGNISILATDGNNSSLSDDADFTNLGGTTSQGASSLMYAVGDETGNTSTSSSSDDMALVSTAIIEA